MASNVIVVSFLGREAAPGWQAPQPMSVLPLADDALDRCVPIPAIASTRATEDANMPAGDRCGAHHIWGVYVNQEMAINAIAVGGHRFVSWRPSL